MIKSKEREQWIGLIFDKNMLDSGKTIINKDGECIFGFSQKVKENISEIDMKALGWMESEMDMASFTMQMDPSMKDIGKIIWNRILPFIPIKMGKLSSFSSKKTEWSVKIIQLLSKNPTKKALLRKKLNLTFTLYVFALIHFITHSHQICSFCSIIFFVTIQP